MKKMITGVLAAATILGTVSAASAEEVSVSSLSTNSLSASKAQSAISAQSDRQGPYIVGLSANSQTRHQYTQEVNGRGRTGHFNLTFENGSSGVKATLLESNGGAWKSVGSNGFLEVNITSGVASKQGTFFMKNGYSYKVKIEGLFGSGGSASIQNF